MKQFRYLCVCLCVTFLSIGFSTSALAETYTLTGRATTSGDNKGGIDPLLTELTSDDTLIVTADNAQIYFNTNDATLNCNININGSGFGTEKTGKIRLQSSGNVINGVVTLLGDTVVGSHLSNGAFGVTFNGQITGANAMIYAAGNGSTITLANTSDSAFNNYTGNTFLGYTGQYYSSTAVANNGIKVVLGASEQIPDAKTSGSTVTGNLVMNAYSTSQYASLNLNGFNETVNGLASGGTAPGNAVIFNNSEKASVLTVGGNNATAEYSGKIGAGGTNLSLVKVGTGTQTLSNANTYTGGTFLNEGTLKLTVNNGISSGSTVTFAQGRNSTLDIGATTQTIKLGEAGKTDRGTIIGSAGSTLNISNGGDFWTQIQLDTGNLNLTGGAVAFHGTYTFGTLTQNSNGSLWFYAGSNVTGNISRTASSTQSLYLGASGTGASGDTIINGDITGNWKFEGVSNKVTIDGTVKINSNLILNSGANLTFKNSTETVFKGDNYTNAALQIGNGGNTSGTVTIKDSVFTAGSTAAITSSSRKGAINLGIYGGSSGVLNVDHSTLNVDGRILIAANANNARGTLNITNNSTVTLGVSGYYSSADATSCGVLWIGQGVSTINIDNSTLALFGLVNTSAQAGSSFNLNNATIKARADNTGFFNANSNIAFKVQAGGVTFDTDSFNVKVANILSSGVDGASDGGLTKTGTGTLTLSAANTFTGATTVSAGTLDLGIANAIATSNSVINNAAITFGATSQTFNALTGTGSITGTGALTLFNDTATDSTYSGTITGTGASVTKTGTGTLTLSGANTYTGATTITDGRIIATNASALGTGTLTNNSELEFNLATDGTYGKVISGSGELIKSGTGTLTLSAANTYTGATTVSAGTLDLTNTSAAGTGAITLGDANTAAQNVTLKLSAANIANNITVANAGTGAVTLYGNALHSNYTGTITLNRDTYFEIPQSGTNDWWFGYAGAISGSGDIIVKGGAGTSYDPGHNRIWFSGDNSGLTGNFIVQSGAAQLSNAKAAGSGTIYVGNANSDTETVRLILGANTNNNIVISADTPITSTPVIASYNGTQEINSPIEFNRSATIYGSSDRLTFQGAWSGNGDITIDGKRVTHDTSANTWTGDMVINSGATFQPGHAQTLSAANDIEVNGTLQLNGVSQTIGALSGSGTIKNIYNPNTLTVDQATDSTFSGTLINGSGTLTFIKDGAGTLTLSGTNTYTGATTITDGRIIATNASALGTGTLTNNSELEFNLATDGSYGKVISGSGELIKSGTGTLTLSAANTYDGATTVSEGTLDLTVADAIISSSSVINNAAITFTGNQTLKNLSSDTTAGTRSVSGTGVLTLDNNKDTQFVGDIEVDSISFIGSEKIKINGTLKGSITFSGTPEINLLGTLKSGDLIIPSGSTFSPGNSIGNFTLENGNYTLKSGATHLVELTGDPLDWDKLFVTGAVTLDEGSFLNIALDGVTLNEQQKYELISSTDAITNAVTLLDLPGWELAVLTSGFEGYTNGLFLQKAAEAPVPEPSTWALLILGALGMMYFRRWK